MEFSSMGGLINMAVTYGLGVVFSIVLLWYVLKENSKREERLVNVLDKHLLMIDDHVQILNRQLLEHDSRAAAAIQQLTEANRYQREEHMAMMKVINEMLVEVKTGRRGEYGNIA